jgi:hypothetical protein
MIRINRRFLSSNHYFTDKDYIKELYNYIIEEEK